MVFSSVYFIFHFLPMVLVIHALAPKRAKLAVLVIFSYLFYGWANPLFAGLLLFSTLLDFLCARWMVRGHGESLQPDQRRTRSQKIALIISILANLGILAFFKYYHFAFDNIHALLGMMGDSAESGPSPWSIILPLGLSFYTLQSMSYTIDVYRGKTAATRNPLQFAGYVAMFPQLVAGPIVRWSEISKQLIDRRQTFDAFARGAVIFSIGLSKKVLLANPCGRIADAAFDAHALERLDAWLGALGYSMQIYFDFSAYSDMAIGLGLMFGLSLPINFNSPYKADSFADFWRRWHISLSTWLRDYLYIPLGGSQRGLRRTYINLLLVMLIGGFWHGAAWTFVIWGGCHGLFLIGERLLARTHCPTPPPWLRKIIVFVLVTITWVLFRSESITDAGRYLGAMFAWTDAPEQASMVGAMMFNPYLIATLCMAMGTTWFGKPTSQLGGQLSGQLGSELGTPLSPWVAAYALILLVVSVLALSLQTYNPFIYFHF